MHRILLIDDDERLAELKTIEARLVTEPDPEFRFHSGLPAWGSD